MSYIPEINVDVQRKRIQIGIMGAGAIGCYFGGRLVASGAADVIFVGRQSLADAIAEHGLTLREFDDEENIPASRIRFETGASALADCDVVLCCVKSGATAETARDLAEVLSPDAVVVSLQNGMRNPDVLRIGLPRNRVVAAIVGFNVVMREHAVFHHTTSGPLLVEVKSASRDRRWIDALRASQVEVQEENPIAPEQWTKLLFNLNNAINALSGVPTRQMVLSRDYRRIVAMVLDEALDVLEVAGIRTAKFRGVPLRTMAFIMRLPTPIVRLVVRAQLRIAPDSRSSMWQDLARGRQTEIDFLNGEVVRLADKHGVDAPLNRRIVELVKAAEQAGTGSPELSAGALMRALRAA